MKIKCEYCGAYINDYDETCKNCGAQNKNLKRTRKETPKTIEELKKWYSSVYLASEERAKIFIGKDKLSPNSIGIYEDTQKSTFVAYQTNQLSEKEITYEGKDEEYAVSIIYDQIKDRIMKDKNNTDRIVDTVTGAFSSFQKIHSFMTAFVMIFIFVVAFIMIFSISRMMIFR